MKNITILIVLVLFTCFAYANKFEGKWLVTKIYYPNNYFSEIKYPKSFELKEVNGKHEGNYTDQFDYKCDFILSKIINAGNELLLLTCGTTKHSTSWAPLHKVKLIDDKLVGSVITKTQRFIWYAKKIPLLDGSYKFSHKYAEHPNMPSISLDAVIKNGRIKLTNNDKDGVFPLGVIDEGEIFWHEESSQWIIANSKEDKEAKEVGSCTSGPSQIDLVKKIYWTC